MFDTTKKIESLDHKNLPKPYKPEDLKKLNQERQAAAGQGDAAADETAPETKPE